MAHDVFISLSTNNRSVANAVCAALEFEEIRCWISARCRARALLLGRDHPRHLTEESTAALRNNAKARKTFEDFAPSKRREYLEWVTEAKREETRKERLAKSIEWLAEGKPRHWKYMPAKK